jgi:hypothetical protein
MSARCAATSAPRKSVISALKAAASTVPFVAVVAVVFVTGCA